MTEHLQNSADICSEFSECIGMADYGKITALQHDIGKYSEKFQKRINGENLRVDHSTCGAQEAFRRKLLMKIRIVFVFIILEIIIKQKLNTME